MDVLTTIVHVWMSLQQMVMLVIDANVCRAFVGIHIYRMAVKVLSLSLCLYIIYPNHSGLTVIALWKLLITRQQVSSSIRAFDPGKFML